MYICMYMYIYVYADIIISFSYNSSSQLVLNMFFVSFRQLHCELVSIFLRKVYAE